MKLFLKQVWHKQTYYMFCQLYYTHKWSTYMCYRYAISAWQSGSNRLPPRQLLDTVVEQLLTWHQKCSKILMWLELPNMMFTVLASFCGNYWQGSSRLNMVWILCSCKNWKDFSQRIHFCTVKKHLVILCESCESRNYFSQLIVYVHLCDTNIIIFCIWRFYSN